MRYYFRHVRENAYANEKYQLVAHWLDAITFLTEKEADKFFMEMCEATGSMWDMCECSDEQWNTSGGRLTPPHKGITVTINGEVVFRQEEI